MVRNMQMTNIDSSLFNNGSKSRAEVRKNPFCFDIASMKFTIIPYMNPTKVLIILINGTETTFSFHVLIIIEILLQYGKFHSGDDIIIILCVSISLSIQLQCNFE